MSLAWLGADARCAACGALLDDCKERDDMSRAEKTVTGEDGQPVVTHLSDITAARKLLNLLEQLPDDESRKRLVLCAVGFVGLTIREGLS